MNLFDLLFLALLLAAAATLLAAAALALHMQFVHARRILERLLACAGAYMGIVIAVSLILPRRVIRQNERLCFDDWCIAVEEVERQAQNGVANYTVGLRLSSRALRVAQRENNLAVYLTDDLDRRYDPLPDPSAVPFQVLLHPGSLSRCGARLWFPPMPGR